MPDLIKIMNKMERSKISELVKISTKMLKTLSQKNLNEISNDYIDDLASMTQMPTFERIVNVING